MSGHSHWAGIKHRKGLNDAKRGKVFTKHGKLITIAARSGGNPDMNFQLRLAIDRARLDNMPKDNIERAIKRGTGELKGESIEEIVYEAFGPGGIMMIIKTLTDNRNRTVSEIKTILGKFEAKLGGPGSVMWNFDFSNLEYKPRNTTAIDEKTKEQYEKLLEALDENEDIQEVYDNL
jgi:YebC/PmpR family DNA-binding regulatory protein